MSTGIYYLTELEACIDSLNIAAGPDPMDLYKAKTEAL